MPAGFLMKAEVEAEGLSARPSPQWRGCPYRSCCNSVGVWAKSLLTGCVSILSRDDVEIPCYAYQGPEVLDEPSLDVRHSLVEWSSMGFTV